MGRWVAEWVGECLGRWVAEWVGECLGRWVAEWVVSVWVVHKPAALGVLVTLR